MNIRISPGTLRFRLGSADVAALRATGELSQALPIGPGPESPESEDTLTFSLRMSDRADHWSIRREPDRVLVEGPEPPLRLWLEGPTTELETRLRRPDLLVLIEKDHHDL